MDFYVGKRKFNRNFSKRTAVNKTAIFMICNLMMNQSLTTLPRLKTLQIRYSRHFKKTMIQLINRRFDTILVSSSVSTN